MKHRNRLWLAAGGMFILALAGCTTGKLTNGGTGVQASAMSRGSQDGSERPNPINSRSGTSGTGVGVVNPAAPGGPAPGTPAATTPSSTGGAPASPQASGAPDHMK